MAIDLAMRQQIESGSPAIQAAALTHCLQQSSLDPESLLLAIPLTNSVHESVRESAVGICERDDEWPVEILPQLTQLVSVSSGDALYWSATLISRFGDNALAAIPTLISKLQQPQTPSATQRLLLALRKIGSLSTAQLKVIEPFIKHPDPHVALTAQQILDS
jgi:hypothetical protein